MVKSFKTILIVLLLITINANGLKAEDALTKSYTEVDSQAVSEMLKQGNAVIDIRSFDDWVKTGVIDTSYLMSAFDIENRITKDFVLELQSAISTEENVVLVCSAGPKAAFVADFITKQLGYKKVYVLTGGINEWQKNGLPLSAFRIN